MTRALWNDFLTECDKDVFEMIFDIRLGSPLILLYFFPFLVFIPFCIVALICFVTKQKVGTVTVASGLLTVWAFFFFAITLSWPRGVGSWPWDFYQVITVAIYAVITVLGFRRLRARLYMLTHILGKQILQTYLERCLFRFLQAFLPTTSRLQILHC